VHTKVRHPDLLSSVFRRSQKYLCAVSLEPADLCHQICIAGASDMDAE